MIAIVQIGGHQALVKEGEKIEVDKLDVEVGKTVSFDTLLVSEADGTNFQLGAPILKNIQVTAKILEHDRGDKIKVFKMKPRKRYRRTQGHRQDYTLIEIVSIGGTEKASTSKKAVKEETTDAPKKKDTQASKK